MSAEALAFDYQDRPQEAAGQTGDREIANRVNSAVTELQDALDRAVLAGLIVEPAFARIENRLTQCGARVDSYVCKIHVLRRLT